MSPFLGTSNPLQYMDWCDVVTVGCLDFPSLDTSTYNTHYIVVVCVVYMSINVFTYTPIGWQKCVVIVDGAALFLIDFVAK